MRERPSRQSTKGEYRAAGTLYRRARLADDEALRALLRNNPMDGWVRLGLERSPGFFQGEGLMGPSVAVIAEDASDPNRHVGMYYFARLPVMLDGRPTSCGYLGGLRVSPDYRHRLRLLKQGFRSVSRLTQPESTGVPLWFTSIASDNQAARRLLEAGLPGMPRYTPRGELETLAISTRRGRSSGLLRQALPLDIRRLAAFHNAQAAACQLAPHIDPAWLADLAGDKGLRIEDFWLLEQGTSIQACLALWDQRAFKQTVVRGFRFPLNRLRPLHNLAAGLLARPQLPRAGERLESIHLAFFARSAAARASAIELIGEALYLARRRGASLGLLGLALDNPLLSEVRRAFRPVSYRTCIETIDWPGSPSLSLEPLPVQPEIALL